MRLVNHIQKFEHFVNVVEAGSISKGSVKSFITQPQMTKIIKQLEEATSQILLVRSKDGVKPTQQGFLLYKHAKNIINSTNLLDLELQNQNISQGGHISIGTYDSIARYFFPDFLKYINKVAPLLKISITTNKSHIIQEQLRIAELDMAIIVDPKKIEGITTEEIYTDHFQLYSPNSQSITDIPERLIYFNDLGENKNIFFSQNNFNEFAKCDNIETVKALTEQGLGYGLLPTKVAREGLLQNKLKKYSSKLETLNEVEHKICFCMKSNDKKEETLFLRKEISRYLKIWSNS